MPRTAAEHAEINRMLQSHGLGRLEDGNRLLSQLGYLVRDHEHLRSLIGRCPPEDRVAMYESLKPSLRFAAWPLDVYVARTADLADRKNLPTLKPDGDFQFQSDARATGLCVCEAIVSIRYDDDMTPICKTCGRPVADPDQAVAQDAVNWALAKEQLTVTCMKCTKVAYFAGDTRAEAIWRARNDGWSIWEHEGQKREVCPDCPVGGRKQ